MKRGNVILVLVLTMLIAGCMKQPTGSATDVPESPLGIGDIVKDTLPSVKEVEVKEEYLARITVNEGELVDLDLEASDPDGDKITYTFGEPLDDQGRWQTEVGDRGEYPVELKVSDGTLESESMLLIIVEAVNQAPVIIAPEGDIEVIEGQTIVLDLQAMDPDDDELIWVYGAPFSDEGVWETEFGDRGTYKALASVSDGKLSSSIPLTIIVLPGDRPPVLEVPREITVKEGEIVFIDPVVSDPDDDELTVTYSGWMETNEKQTGYEDAGEWKVVVTVSDGLMEESQTVKIIVENVNRAPEILGIIVK